MSPINDYIEDSPESISATIDSEDKASAASLQVDTDKDPNESSASQHHTLRSLRSRPRTLAVSLAPIATKLHRKIKVDEDVHRHLDYSPASFPSLDPNIYPTRRHSPSLLTDADHALNFRRHRWNLARVNYCELERLDDYCPQSDQTALSSPPPSPLSTDQDIIGWDHFMSGRISISFSPIVASYFRINKSGRRFTTKIWFTAVIASLFEIHQQAWLTFYSTNTCTSSTNKIASPPKKTLLSLIAQYYQLSGILRKLQR